MSKNYLLEIGVEEMPARFVNMALDQIFAKTKSMMKESEITATSLKTYATPRRLVLWIEDIKLDEQIKEKEVKGPSAKIAYDEQGTATKALLGFLKGQGAAEQDVYTKSINGTDYVFVMVKEEAKSFSEIISSWAPSMIKSISFPKSMKWGGKSLRFARPIRWIVSLLHDSIIPFELDGISVGRVTSGHRVLGDAHIELKTTDDYFSVLEKNGVIVDQEKRRNLISYHAKRLAVEVGGTLKSDEDLLDEIVNIVEYPNPIRGSIAPEYLSLPEKVVTTPMREHLRFMPIYDESGSLLPYFITVRNGDDKGIDTVIKGNEKVLTARLADAKFFFEDDITKPLIDYTEDLKGVTFHEKLGSLWDKTRRAQRLGEFMSGVLSLGKDTRANIERTALLSKADLMTKMVAEFTELQGFMGHEYAKLSNENDIVSLAIEEQYMPRFADDGLPTTTTGSVISLIDKLDTLVGLFCIGIFPTGSQDPFALRRSALGIINIILEKKMNIDLGEMVDQAMYGFMEVNEMTFHHEEVRDKVMEFFRGRMKTVLQDRGIRYDIIEGVLNEDKLSVLNVVVRAEQVNGWIQDHDIQAFFDAYNRIGNLVENKNLTMPRDDLMDEEERKLYFSIEEIKQELDENLDRGKYRVAMDQLASLVPAINRYFDQVMVMVEDDEIRNNRLALLDQLYQRAQRILNVKCVVSK